jgi:L-amino acid N-acyltransferase YncA
VAVETRTARPDDAEAIARIYNEGIEDRLATFETDPRSARDVAAWLERGFPLVVAQDETGTIVAWASAPPYRPRAAYAGVAEFSIYVARDRRGHGFGRAALAALVEECERRGLWKLVSRIFPENEPSLALCRSLGFREVGVYRRHGKLDGAWRDCVIVELLLRDAR